MTVKPSAWQPHGPAEQALYEAAGTVAVAEIALANARHAYVVAKADPELYDVTPPPGVVIKDNIIAPDPLPAEPQNLDAFVEQQDITTLAAVTETPAGDPWDVSPDALTEGVALEGPVDPPKKRKRRTKAEMAAARAAAEVEEKATLGEPDPEPYDNGGALPTPVVQDASLPLAPIQGPAAAPLPEGIPEGWVLLGHQDQQIPVGVAADGSQIMRTLPNQPLWGPPPVVDPFATAPRPDSGAGPAVPVGDPF